MFEVRSLGRTSKSYVGFVPKPQRILCDNSLEIFNKMQ
ncbi:SLEI motif protein [Leptospira interrogans]|uniref:SLEI motif protein n=2 Tax=Leptospira interrogans TaxID=173 RepID=A0AAP9WFL6_LEPIR|nr:SLEI motif protein [Leptospira interrogans serovar Copenhageni]ASV07373.1 SLEI motif protein [Leptospira interrogans serovar Canicola]KAA1267407.1 SLEI motif protein [Leptospira interrogans serovar Weerasinghe]KAA1292000.1 SLEI motif protein [Leptospira interrogans serovar Geyaweera]MBE0304771.1 SLEI motif protein [Leptospira interrogans serovar Yeoncheon]OOB93424.1 SLEI motif protein [Leptospira interrogans serovar Hardjo]OOB99477.1 SLEI motif protein [Leptospira interrogans serovar Austr